MSDPKSPTPTLDAVDRIDRLLAEAEEQEPPRGTHRLVVDRALAPDAREALKEGWEAQSAGRDGAKLMPLQVGIENAVVLSGVDLASGPDFSVMVCSHGAGCQDPACRATAAGLGAELA